MQPITNHMPQTDNGMSYHNIVYSNKISNTTKSTDPSHISRFRFRTEIVHVVHIPKLQDDQPLPCSSPAAHTLGSASSLVSYSDL
ncbi:hypothetical protein Hanom_Chr01g00036881 [Helianthus anomalus]